MARDLYARIGEKYFVDPVLYYEITDLIGPRDVDLTVQVAEDKDANIRRMPLKLAGSSLGQFVILAPASARGEEAATGNATGESFVQIDKAAALDTAERDFTIYARIKTRENGTIFAKAPRGEEWAPDGTTFFIRGGHLTYDVGWVGAVHASKGPKVNDGKWHD